MEWSRGAGISQFMLYFLHACVQHAYIYVCVCPSLSIWFIIFQQRRRLQNTVRAPMLRVIKTP